MFFDPFFSWFGPLFFILVFGIIITILISNLNQWQKNNRSPQLTVPARVVTKRTETYGGAGDSSASTDYYVTFEVESGDRIELKLRGTEYGMLAENDIGRLTFQGTRYLSFERQT